MSTYRILVALDLDAPTATDAYEKMYKLLSGHTVFDRAWESSDEWYDPEGRRLSLEEVEDARDEAFRRMRANGEIE